MTEPNKEAVRTQLPTGPDKASPSGAAAKQETVRIILPSRTPAAPGRRVPPNPTPLPGSDLAAEPRNISPRRPPVVFPQSIVSSPLLQPLPKPPGRETPGAITPLPASEGEPAPSTDAGPKNETAQISILPGPLPAPKLALDMVAAAKPFDAFDAVPKSFCWGLFGIAALIFLIQIWNYVVS